MSLPRVWIQPRGRAQSAADIVQTAKASGCLRGDGGNTGQGHQPSRLWLGSFRETGALGPGGAESCFYPACQMTLIGPPSTGSRFPNHKASGLDWVPLRLPGPKSKHDFFPLDEASLLSEEMGKDLAVRMPALH